MNIIFCNGSNPEVIAEKIGGVLIAYDATNDKATIAGGDPEKLTA